MQVRKCAIRDGYVKELDSQSSPVKYKTCPKIAIPEDAADLPRFLSPDATPFARMIFARAVRCT